MVKPIFFIFAYLLITNPLQAQNIELPSPPTPDSHEYQLVVVNYGEEVLSTQVKESLAKDFLQAMAQLGLSTLSVDSLKNLQMNFKSFHEQLAAALLRINDSLPEDEAVAMNIVYLPIAKQSLLAKNSTLSPLEISGDWATAVNSVKMKTLQLSTAASMGDTEFDWYTSVSNSLALHNQAMSQVADSPGLYFSALQMQMSLQKDQSSMQLQILAGLNQQKITLDKINDQVRIRDMVVPGFTDLIDQNANVPMAEAPGYFSKAPVMVMSTSFIQTEPESPLELGLSLGAFNGLGGNWTGVEVIDEFALAATAQPSEVGAAQWLNECQTRMTSVPSLQGTLAKGAIGQGKLGELVEKAEVSIGFHFFNMWFQFNDEGEPYIPPGNLDVRVAVAGGLGGFAECIVMGDVNEQLSGELNATIKAQLEELLEVNSLADELLSQF